MTLDWSTFRLGREGPEAAFEAFACQLFERWVVRTHGTQVTTYVLRGAGGDGGVEAFATLSDGSTLGLQAKWFPGNIGESEIRQIRRSIEAAVRSHPTLVEYVIALPRNLTPGVGNVKSGPNKGAPQRGGVQRWDELVSGFRSSHASLTIVRWDENELLQQLAQPGNSELRTLWFEGNLDISKLEDAWEKAQRRLGDRYLPNLHAANAIQEALERDTYVKDALHWPAILSEGERALSAAQRSVADFSAVSGATSSPPLQAALSHATTRLADWLTGIATLRLQLRRGPLGGALTLLDDEPLRSLKSHLDDLKWSGQLYHATELCLVQVDAALTAIQPVSRVAAYLDQARSPRLVVGPYGSGKSHAGAAATAQHLEQGLPAVFLQLKDADPTMGLVPVLAQALDLVGWPAGRIFDALEALALQSEALPAEEVRQTLFARALVVIDGVEESHGWSSWRGPLADLVQFAAARPRVHFSVAMRPDTATQLALPRAFNVQQLPEDGGVSLPELLRAYASGYKVDVGDVPWLGWAVRNPLTVRLLVEEFEGSSISRDEGATANMASLFQRKLARIERETRAKYTSPWSETLSLVVHVLEELATLVAVPDTSLVLDREVIRRVSPMDPEFTAERIRFVLKSLVEYGLVVAQQEGASSGLFPPSTRYGLAHRHIADYVLARRLADSTLGALDRDGIAEFPANLEHNKAVAELFVTMLAESDRFVTDAPWVAAPTTAEQLELVALALVSPTVAEGRTRQVKQMMLQSAKTNREVLTRLVLPVARIPGHPLGPRLLDEALRTLPMAKRDPLWSVPSGLPGSGVWQDAGDLDLERVLPLSPEADEWNGLPLVVAWACSSVVEATRLLCREALALWGGGRLDHMVNLLRHMASVDDLQVVEDMFVAAFGASLAAPLDDPHHLVLATLVDELVFAPVPTLTTTDVVVLQAARGIVERTASLHPNAMKGELARARPPYPTQRTEDPPVDASEARDDRDGAAVVTDDLDWYVAKRSFDEFVGEPRDASPSFPRGITRELHAPILDGRLPAPQSVARDVRAHAEAQAEGFGAEDGVLASFRFLYRSERQREGLKEGEEDFDSWLEARLDPDTPAPTPPPPRYSKELMDLLGRLSDQVGQEVSPNAARNGMLAAIVRSWGWSETEFSAGDWKGNPVTVDRAISKVHASASHGERSAVATFREKYVWLAVNVLAGSLASRLPVWDEEADEWRLLDSVANIGNGTPDPLPQSPCVGEAAVESWEPDGVWLDEVPPASTLGLRATGLLNSPLPDPHTLVRCRAETWNDAAVVGYSAFRLGLHSTVDQLIRVRGLAVPKDDLELFLRDAPFLEPDDEASAGVTDSVYLSPAVHCWARWARWEGEVQTYESFRPSGEVVSVRQYPLLGEGTAHTTHESTVWMPAPMLRDSLGVAAMRGGGDRRVYVDSNLSPVAVERARRPEGHNSIHQYLVVPWDRLVEVTDRDAMELIWIVRLLRTATPALWMNDAKQATPPPELPNRARDVHWLVTWNRAKARLDTVLLSDVLQPFKAPSSGT